nr:hypothetical protein [Tanacetum cinerariifolium]
MAAVEVPQTLEYRGGQLNAAPVLEVKIFTNWKKRFMCHITSIEPQFENIISNGPFVPMEIGQRKPEAQWTANEGKAANLDQRLKSLIMSVLRDDQMNSVFQDSPDDEEDTRSSYECINDLEEEYQAKALLDKSKIFFKNGAQRFSSAKVTNQNKCHKYGKKGHFVRDFWSKTSVPSDNDDRKSFLDYLYIDLNYVEEQRNNLSSKHRNLVQELNACKEQLLVLKQVKHDLLTMQHVNTEILKENQNLRLEVKELTSITETWLNSSSKVNQCINEQIPTQKKKILGIGQLAEYTSSCGSKGMVFVKSLADNSDMSITSSNLHKSSKAEDSTLPNHNTDEKLDGTKLGSGPKTVKSILKSKSMFKAETIKGITLNEPSSAPARGNKSSSASKTNSAPVGKLKNVNVEDDPPLAMVIKEHNKLKLQISKKKSSYFRNKNTQQHHTGQGESSSRSIPLRPLVTDIIKRTNQSKTGQTSTKWRACKS